MLTKQLTLVAFILLAAIGNISGQSKIYWLVNSPGTVKSAFQDGTSIQTLVTGANSPDGSCISSGLGKIFWVEGGSGKIRKANFDGTSVSDLVSLPTVGLRGITIDEPSNKLYFVGTAGFGYCNLDGSNVVLHLGVGLGERGIAYNPSTKKLYITNQSTRLISVDTSGANNTILFNNLNTSWGVKIDVEGQQLYYSDRLNVFKCNLDGSNNTAIITMVSNSSQYTSLAVDSRNNKLFWFGNNNIMTSTLTGSSQTSLITGLNNVFDISVIGGSSVQSNNIIFSNITQTTASIIWNKGNGTGRVAFLAATNTGTPNPQNGTSYTANTTFGSGSQIGTSGWYCIYNGTDSVVNISGLTPGTTYRLMVTEFSGAGLNLSYNVSVSTLNPNNFTTLNGPGIILSNQTLTTFSSCVASASSNQSFTLSGSGLTNNIIITPPTGFEVSTIAGSGYASSISLIPNSGSVANTAIFVRLAANATGTPTGNISVASLGATTQNVAVTGIVTTPITTNTITAAQTICSGSTANSLTGSTPTGGDGTNYTYAWQSSTTTATAGFSAALNTNSNYQPTSLTQTTWFRRVVTSGACAADSSTAVKITVTAPVTNNTITAAQIICSGSTPNSLTGSTPTDGDGTNYTYTWQSSTTSATAGFGAALNTNSNYQPTSLTQTTWFRRVVTSGACAADSSAAVKITVTAPVTNNTINASQTICASSAPTQLTGSAPTGGDGTTYTYVWQQSTTSSTAGFSNALNTNTTINYQPTSLTQTTWFRRVVTSGACAADSSAAVKITVTAPVTNNTITAAQTICSGSTANSLTGSTPTGGDGTNYTYAWQSSTTSATAGFSAALNTNSNYQPTSLTQTTWFRRVVTSGACNGDSLAVVMITVNALPALTTITGPSSVCQGNTITQSNTASAGVWSSGNTTIATINNSGVVTGVTAGVATINYIVTNANNCSITNTKNLTVLSQPARTPIIKDTLICKATSFTVDATIPSTATYSWTATSGGFTSILPKIIISNPALYRLNITLSNGCFYLDSINLRNTTDTAIRAKLQVSAQGFINDDVVAVNLTNPSPQNTIWSIPNGSQIVSQSATYLILKFANTGKYQIGLNTTSYNVCSTSDSGIVIISIKDTAVNNTPNTASVVVREVNVGPNPSNGIYNFNIKLNKSGKVSLRIYSITGLLAYSTVIPESTGITNINKQVDITASQRNTYIAVIQSADSYEVRTLIKN